MIVEIPRWTNAKMEINKKEILNPIAQDIKHNQLRFVHNIFPYCGYITNYGALPQTWEDPTQLDELTQLKGDNDPLDVCEIGSRKHKRGSVIGVKVIGALGLIDEGETDWKIIAIDHTDELADQIQSIEDVENQIPGLLDAIRDWFRIYKIPSGKPANTFAFNGNYLNKEAAHKIIQHNHNAWSDLFKQSKVDSSQLKETLQTISLFNSTLTNSSTISTEQANSAMNNNNKSQEYIQFNSDMIEKLNYVNRTKLE
jgi:inorganic pyrophosphatase